jgi:hypothetical protein
VGKRRKERNKMKEEYGMDGKRRKENGKRVGQFRE